MKNNSENLLVQLLSAKAEIPKQQTTGSTGYDLYSLENTTLEPHTRGLVSTGISVRFPLGTYRRIAPHSGLSLKHSIVIGVGVIDRDYRRDIKTASVKTYVWISHGFCVAQLDFSRLN